MPIRILHVVTNMCRGGLETMIMNYYRHVDRTQIQFDFLVHRDYESEYDAEILAMGGRIHHLPRLNPFSSGYLGRLDAFFSEHPEYRIVHSHLDCMAGIPLKYAKKHGDPVRIGHAHNSNQPRDLKYPLKLIYKHTIAQNATALLACGEEAGQWMFGGAPFQVMNNAVDAELFRYAPDVRSEVRREFGIEEGALVVGHVGRFMQQKNHAFLLQIFSRLPGDAKLLLVGDGELRTEVQTQARELGIEDRVILAGVRADVHRMMQAMDVFLLPSHHEGLPLTIVEAQCAGLPCLISDGVPIECKKTDLVSQLPLAASADAWAEATLTAVRDPRTSPLQQIRAAGFDIVEKAGWLTDYYFNHYKKKV